MTLRPTANALHSRAEMGFTFYVEVLDRHGRVGQREVVHNLIPQEGLDHTMGVVFKSATQVPTWYIALYEGNYTPVPGTKASTFPTDATECTAYSQSTRVEFNEGAVITGSVDNSANRAEFTFTQSKTVYGGVISSAAAKGATTGVLISAVRFSSPKVLETGDTLRVIAANSLISS